MLGLSFPLPSHPQAFRLGHRVFVQPPCSVNSEIQLHPLLGFDPISRSSPLRNPALPFAPPPAQHNRSQPGLAKTQHADSRESSVMKGRIRITRPICDRELVAQAIRAKRCSHGVSSPMALRASGSHAHTRRYPSLRYGPLSGFRTLLAASSARCLPALFHAGTPMGFSLRSLFPALNTVELSSD